MCKYDPAGASRELMLVAKVAKWNIQPFVPLENCPKSLSNFMGFFSRRTVEGNRSGINFFPVYYNKIGRKQFGFVIRSEAFNAPLYIDSGNQHVSDAVRVA